MKFVTLPALAVVLSAFADAEGINCKGSAMCSYLHRTGGLNLNDFYNDIRAKLGEEPDRHYEDGQHITCHKITRPHIIKMQACAFLQKSNGAHIKTIANLTGELVNHGCSLCGSVPLSYPDSNDIKTTGMLTFNYVHG